MFAKIRLSGSILFATAALSACGGGGGGTATPVADTTAPTVSPVTATTTFSLQSGYKNLIVNGQQTQFNISGTCGGSASISASAATGATYEGSPALSTTETTTANYTGCNLQGNFVPLATYYDSNYSPIGSMAQGNSFGKYFFPATQLPSSVKVGDSGQLGNETLFTDNTKTVLTGSLARRFVIESDGVSSTSAIANLIVGRYDANNQLTTTTQKRYRISSNGSLTPVSIDVMSTAGNIHLIYTAI